jgi:hypothetical protein
VLVLPVKASHRQDDPLELQNVLFLLHFRQRPVVVAADFLLDVLAQVLAQHLGKAVHLVDLHAPVDKANSLLQLEQLLVGQDLGVDIFAKQVHALLSNLEVVGAVVEHHQVLHIRCVSLLVVPCQVGVCMVNSVYALHTCLLGQLDQLFCRGHHSVALAGPADNSIVLHRGRHLHRGKQSESR